VWGQEPYREQLRKAKGTDFEPDPEEGPYQSATVKIWFADGTPPWQHQAEPDDDDALGEEGDVGNLFAVQHETNDAIVKECPRLSLVKGLSFRGLGEAVNDELVHAIGGKHLVEFVYKAGRTRIVEPHDYGIRGDVERLLGFQIGGESQSGASHGWKEFDVDQIRCLRVLDRRFAGTRADSAQHHRTWDLLFARVT
jgi:hypothetical protein